STNVARLRQQSLRSLHLGCSLLRNALVDGDRHAATRDEATPVFLQPLGKHSEAERAESERRWYAETLTALQFRGKHEEATNDMRVDSLSLMLARTTTLWFSYLHSQECPAESHRPQGDAASIDG